MIDKPYFMHFETFLRRIFFFYADFARNIFFLRSEVLDPYFLHR